MTDKNPVATPSTYHTNQKPLWMMVDTLVAGTFAMRAAGKKYLPQEPKETAAAYKNRIQRSVLTPLYEDTLNKLIGKILKQPVVLNDDVPAPLMEIENDIDAAGADINEWTKRIAFSALNHGVTYMLVDAPNEENLQEELGRELTREDVLSGLLRPYAIHIEASQVLGWKTEKIGGKIRLSQIRIHMVTEEDSPEDEFTQQTVERIHVWEIGLVSVYRKVTDDNKTEWVLEDVRTYELDYIPLIPVYGKYEKFMEGDPPLLEIAHLNVTHWQSDSDQRNILHVARVPILFGSGLGNDKPNFEIEVGPNTMTKGPMGSDMKFVEHSGAGIEAGAKDLETIEQRVAKIGLNMITKRQSGDITATSRVLDQAEADSPLGMLARHLEKQLAMMFDIFAEFLNLGSDSGGTLTIFKDFSITQRDAEDIKELGNMRARGDISQLTYWEELQRRGLLSDDFDQEKEIDLLDLEYQDNQAGFTEADLESGNSVGDETAAANGHTHILQSNGFTNSVNGHRHRWEPTGSETSVAEDHSHGLKGVADASTSRPAPQQQGATGATGEV